MAATMAGVELDPMVSGTESDTYRFEYDQDATPASLAVVAALSAVMDVDPIELEPLNDSVDGEALDVLAHVRPDTEGDVHVSFTHEAHAVTVHTYGRIVVTPTGDRRSRTGSEDVVHE